MKNDLIEIFIITYNRCALLEQSLRSALNQTVKTKVTVVDNHSTDGTEAMIERVKSEGFNFGYIRRTENGGGGANFVTAIENNTYPYAMIFHDDDLLHPQYIEFALRALQQEKNVKLVCCGSVIFFDNNVPRIEMQKDLHYRLFDSRGGVGLYMFATQTIRPNETPAYSSCIYSREFLHSDGIMVDSYGKIGDRPFMANSVMDGKAILIGGPMCYQRTHGGSDTKFCKNPCTVDNLRNYMSFYRQLASENRDLANLYYLVAGRCLKAIWNFTYGTVNLTSMVVRFYFERLIKIRSLFMLFERCLHIVGMKRDGLLESMAMKRLQKFYHSNCVEVI